MAAASSASSPQGRNAQIAPLAAPAPPILPALIRGFLTRDHSPLNAARVSQLSKQSRVSKATFIDSLVKYLLDQFGLLHGAYADRVLLDPQLKKAYDIHHDSILETFHFLSEGKTDEVRKRVLTGVRVFSTQETADELVMRRINFCVDHLPMPVQQAQEWQIRFGVPVSAPYLDVLSETQQEFTSLLFEFLDSPEPVDLDAEVLTDLEQFVYSDTPMCTERNFINWATLIQNWLKDQGIISGVVLQRMESISRLKYLVEDPSSSSRPSIAPTRSPPSSEESDGDSTPRHSELQASSGDEEKALEPLSFQGYTMRQSLNRISAKLGMPLSPFIHQALTDSYTTEANRKRDLFFIDLSDFLTFPLPKEMVFLVSAQKFLLCEQQAGQKMPLLLDWLFAAPEKTRSSFKPQLHYQGYATAVFIFEHAPTIKPDEKLEIFKRISQLPSAFDAFVRAVQAQNLFPLTAAFFLEGDFRGVDLQKALVAAQLLSRVCATFQAPPLEGDFWASGCAKWAKVPELETQVVAFERKYQGQFLSEDPYDIEAALLSYFGSVWPVYDFELAIGDLNQLQDFVSVFSQLLAPPIPSLTQVHTEGCVNVVRALQKYQLSIVEAARLFFDFISVQDVQEIQKSLYLIDQIERFTNAPLGKADVIQWMHFRPTEIKAENIIGGINGDVPNLDMPKLLEDFSKLRALIVREHLEEFILPLSLFDELTRLTQPLPFASSHSATENHLLCDGFSRSALNISRQLASITIPLSAQVWTDSISAESLDAYQEERSSQHIYRLSQLNPSLPQAAYRAWTINTDPLQLEVCLIDIRDLRTYRITAPLNLMIAQIDASFMALLHEAAICLGEEQLDPTVIRDMKEDIIKRNLPLLKKYPQIKDCKPPLKENACRAIEDLKKKRPVVNPSWLEFEVLLLFYPQFARKWDAYIPVHMSKEAAGTALFEFIKRLKLEFRKATLAFGKALPPSLEEPFGKSPQELASLGHVYPLPKGLSLLPDRPIYHTPRMLETFAIQDEHDRDIEKLIDIMKAPQSNAESHASEGKLASNKPLIPGSIEYQFHPLPQGDEQVPLNELQLTLTLEQPSAKPVRHIVRYGHWTSDDGMSKKILKWHLLMLFSKAHAEVLRLQTEAPAQAAAASAGQRPPEKEADASADENPATHLVQETVLFRRLSRPKTPKPAAAAASP